MKNGDEAGGGGNARCEVKKSQLVGLFFRGSKNAAPSLFRKIRFFERSGPPNLIVLVIQN